jgi:NAD(P)-dependent dehydrogenase (short-subunit alcohol dehydrogenase family)
MDELRSVPSQRLAGRVAVVTGSAGGLGEAIATRLAAEGAAVAGLDIAVPTAPERDGIALFQCDVSEPKSVAAAIEGVVARFGGIDVVVNNAGLLSGRSSLLEMTPEDMHRYYSVNAVGALLVVQSCFPFLRDSSHRGRVINVASRTFFTGGAGQIG